MTTVFSNIENQAPVGPVHALSPGTWLSCVHPGDQPGSARRHHGRPDRRAAHRPGHAAAFARSRDRKPRRRRLLRPRLRLLATPERFRSARRPRRCRWRPIRASCSCVCSARATTPRSARGCRSSTRRCSIWSASEANELQRSAGAVRQGDALRLSGERPRDRAPHSEDGSARSLAGRHPGRAAGHACRSTSTSS